MGKHEVIEVARLAVEAQIEHEIALMGRASGHDIDWGGYSIWLRDDLRGTTIRFNKADEATAWIAARKGERVEHGR